MMIKMLITLTAKKKKGIKVGICGQGPSGLQILQSFLRGKGIGFYFGYNSLFKTLNASQQLNKKLDAVLA
jgi:hypothetical protein